MKLLMWFTVFFTLLAGCSSQPAFVDNGNPGQIKAVVFYDDNKNSTMDAGEIGAPLRVAISQEVSCPPSGTPNFVETDANGETIFTELKPGKYCVFVDNNSGMTTKMNQEGYVSSDQELVVMFGVVRP
jgi:uncharacterized protein (DUF2141 family)